MNIIPAYPDTRPVLLEDKPLLDRTLWLLQPRISEFTFANLFLFRTAHDYGLSMVNDSLVISGKGYEGESYFLPPLTGDRGAAVRILLERGMTLYGADDKAVSSFKDNTLFTIEEDRDNFDYLYLKSDLADLPGNRFHNKKNRINYFTARYEHWTEKYDQKFRQGCFDLLDKWLRVRKEISSSLSPEADAAHEALGFAGTLGLEGVVVIVAGEVKAFALGEKLNATTSVCHFEKADPFMEGLSQLVDREFNRLLFTDCTYANREQDLGEPGLRAAKLSYRPLELVRKYRVRKKG